VDMHERIVDVASVPGVEGYFCLGPFARRVSFIAQQHRALNLVWALAKTGRFEANDSIAVIGGGLAGITAAVAFSAHGCKVDLFERGRLMARQRTTVHRMVHPSVSLWPMHPLSATTTLPFLEWYIGPCNEITNEITRQLKDIQSKQADRFRLLEQCEVTDVLPVGTGLLKLRVQPLMTDRPAYRVVLLVTGFGEEVAHPQFKPIDYWKADGLEGVRDEAENKVFIVSGCGDGGLIDALRLVHRNFEQGRLAFRCAEMLADTPLAASLADAERAFGSPGKEAELASTYEAAARELTKPEYKAVNDMLAESLEPAALVYLVGHALDKPFAPNSTPIHKLLIAHAIGEGSVSYLRGEVSVGPDQCINAGGIVFDPGTLVMIRHGAQPEFRRLLRADQVEVIKAKQQQYLDDIVTPKWDDESYPVPDAMAKHRLNDPAWIPGIVKDRLRLAGRAVRAIEPNANLRATADGYEAEYLDPPAWKPTTLFGVPLSWTSGHPVPLTPG
jgi:hypothetical protein